MHITELPLSKELRKILENCYIIRRATTLAYEISEADYSYMETLVRDGVPGVNNMSDLELVRALHGESYETTDLITIADELLQPKEAVPVKEIIGTLSKLLFCPDLYLDSLTPESRAAVREAEQLKARLEASL